MCAAVPAEQPDAWPGAGSPRRIGRSSLVSRNFPNGAADAAAAYDALKVRADPYRPGSLLGARERVIDALVDGGLARMALGEIIRGRSVRPGRFRIGPFWLERIGDPGRWYRFWKDPVTKQNRKETTGLPDEAEAQRWLAGYVLDHENGAFDQIADPRAEFLVELYLVDPERNESHGGQSASLLRALRSTLPDISVSGLTKDAQKRLLLALAAGPSGKPLQVGTIANAMILLGASVRAACVPDDHGFVLSPRLPPPIITDRKEIAVIVNKAPPKRRDWTPSPELLAAVLREFGDDDEVLRRWLVLALGFACRVSAAAEATAAQLDRQHRLYDLNPSERIQEDDKWRAKLPMPPSLLAEVSCWPETEWVGDVSRNLRNRLKGAAEKVAKGLGDRFVPSFTRHFMAKAFRSAYVDYALPPVPKEQRKLWMGHQRLDTNDGYGEYDPTYLLLARNAVECILHDLDELSGGLVFKEARRAGTLPAGPVVIDPEELGREARRARQAALQAGQPQPSPAKLRAAARAQEGSKLSGRPTHEAVGSHVAPAISAGSAGISEAKTVAIGGRRGKFSQVQPKRPKTLDEAFEPCPLDTLRRPGASFFRFEAEDGACDQEEILVVCSSKLPFTEQP